MNLTVDDLISDETLSPLTSVDDELDDLDFSSPYSVDLNTFNLDCQDGFKDPVYAEIGIMVDAMLNELPPLTPRVATSRRRELERETLEKNGWERHPVAGKRQTRFKYINRYTNEETTALQKALSKCPKTRRRRRSKTHPELV